MAASTPFRLFDLPQEIQNHIYSLALAGPDNARQVANFEFPALTRVSREVRQDTLPILFADSNFVFTVGTNAFCRHPEVNAGLDVAAWNKKHSGTLGFKPAVQRFIKDCSGSAIFRNVTFDLHHPAQVVPARYDHRVITLWSYIHLTLVVEHANVRIELLEGNYHPRRHTQLPAESRGGVERLDKAVENVTTVVREMESRNGFKGFTMKDLRRIAKVFRIDFA